MCTGEHLFRGVFWILSSAFNGAFLAAHYFCEKAPTKMLDRVLNTALKLHLCILQPGKYLLIKELSCFKNKIAQIYLWSFQVNLYKVKKYHSTPVKKVCKIYSNMFLKCLEVLLYHKIMKGLSFSGAKANFGLLIFWSIITATQFFSNHCSQHYSSQFFVANVFL